jgi:ribosome biogenesis protein ERB1
MVKCALAAPARTVAWHSRGDYLATVSPDAIASMQCVVHRCSRRSSQAPLKRGDKGGQIQSCLFHPSKPFLFVASRTTVRVYHLARQELVKTLRSGCKWISCISLHPGGDHCVVGSRDLRLCWHDMDLGEQAHRTLKYHDKALRAACFHPRPGRYPLMATCADDGTVQVFHAKVFDDLMTNPTIVPVKRLDASSKGALDCVFHPTQPWLFSCGADGSVKLFHAL